MEPSSEIFGVLTIACITGVGGLSFVMNQRKKRHDSNAHSEQSISGSNITENPVVPTPSVNTPAAETNILDEVSIYLSYGHLEQAAESLEWYVRHNTEDVHQRFRLLDIYQSIPDDKRFVALLRDMLERGLIQKDVAQQYTISCLKICVGSEVLVGMASDLGIREQPANKPNHKVGMLQQDPKNELENVHNRLKNVMISNADLDNDAGINSVNKAYNTVSPPTSISGDNLVDGIQPIQDITEYEHDICLNFMGYEQACRMLIDANQYNYAIQFLQRCILFNPKDLNLRIALMRILYVHNDLKKYVENTLSLFIVLGQCGDSLKEKILEYGKNIGDGSAFMALNLYKNDPHKLVQMASDYNVYVPSEFLTAASYPLIEEELHTDELSHTVHHTDSVLQEFDSLLDYGQIEEAVSLLEQAVHAQPDNPVYYPHLLAMYDRMDAYDRFSVFIQSILNNNVQPNEDVLNHMLKLSESLQLRQRKEAA